MTTMTANLAIHRLLDEAFAGVPATPTTQDLKEELRASLVARVEELEAAGLAPDEAARRAFAQVGDFRSFLDEALEDLAGEDSPVDQWARHRVRHRPAFVIRATVLPIVGALALAASIVLAALAPQAPAPDALSPLIPVLLMAVFACCIGFVTADSLQQETSTSYPMARGRAIGMGVGLGVLLAGAGAIALCWAPPLPLWLWLVLGAVGIVVGIAVLAGLGAGMTNRRKPWAREAEQAWMRGAEQAWTHGAEQAHGDGAARRRHPGDRFERDPNAAARFGIYTAVLWILAITVGVLLGVFVGWWWAALPAVGAVALMLLLLTRMLFAPERPERSER
ncbi:MAG: hypothetical protein BGO95_06705 [Micrococcales bacterium 73-13]|nr:MAG: hypothetical protein BGO95_06705 [Micrococcales bacterium 73-13]